MKKMWPFSAAEDSDSSYNDDDSICGICQKDLRVPRSLPCRHIFCGACLDDLERKKSPVICPICESSAMRSAVSYLVRQPGKAVVDPSLVQARQTRRESIAKCSEHPQKRLSLQCLQCEVAICKTCLEGSHKGHKTSSLEPASTESLQGTPAKQVDSKQRTEDFLRNLDNVEKSVTENHLQTKQSIEDQYELWSQKLLNRRDVLLREVDDNMNENMAAIARERQIAQHQLEELNNVNEEKNKLTDKSRSNITIPVLLQPSTTSFEAIDADPERFNIGRVIIHRRDQGGEDSGKEGDKTDEDEDVGCFSYLTNNIQNYFTST